MAHNGICPKKGCGAQIFDYEPRIHYASCYKGHVFKYEPDSSEKSEYNKIYLKDYKPI